MGNDSFKLPDPRPADSVTAGELVQLAKFRAPIDGDGQNAVLVTAADLGDALDEFPLFAGLKLGALVGGGGPNAGQWVDPVTLAELTAMGAQPDERYFLHFKFPQSKTKDVHNVGLLLKHFSHGWEVGLSSLLSELGYDGNTYMQVFTDIPAVAVTLRAVGVGLFKLIPSTPRETPDPFAPPTGLSQGQAGNQTPDKE